MMNWVKGLNKDYLMMIRIRKLHYWMIYIVDFYVILNFIHKVIQNEKHDQFIIKNYLFNTLNVFFNMRKS